MSPPRDLELRNCQRAWSASPGSELSSRTTACASGFTGNPGSCQLADLAMIDGTGAKGLAS
jgi:hypothetical protein